MDVLDPPKNEDEANQKQIEALVKKINCVKKHWKEFCDIHADSYFNTQIYCFEKHRQELESSIHQELNNLRIELCILRGE